MGSAARYWRLIRLDAAGKCKVEEIASAKAFFRQQFPDLVSQATVVDGAIQKQLLQLSHAATPNLEASFQQAAMLCLRCFVSSQIEQVCSQLEMQFGSKHGFTRYDLLPFVLEDDGRLQRGDYRPFALELLQTFDPERASLSTWITRLVRHHRELNAFLLEHGVYLVSDWAILNDTTPKQLHRIFADFHQLTPTEIQQASKLLESYHAVYRRDRLEQRQAGGKGQCLPPNRSQLEQIAQLFQAQTDLKLLPESILARLQEIAERLRQYRIYVRGGKPTTESLDRPESQGLADRLQAVDSAQASDDEDNQNQFLSVYRRQFLECLDQSMLQVVRDRNASLQRKNPQTAQQFLTALHLFHCQGKSMGEIAPVVGLQAQYQVTRLLKLKEFRADVRQRLLVALQHYIRTEAAKYTDPERLKQLDQQIEAALDEQITTVIQEAEAEASIAKNRPTKSLFAQRLCRSLRTEERGLRTE